VQTVWDKFSAKHTARADDAKSDLNAAADDAKAAASHVKDAAQR